MGFEEGFFGSGFCCFEVELGVSSFGVRVVLSLHRPIAGQQYDELWRRPHGLRNAKAKNPKH